MNEQDFKTLVLKILNEEFSLGVVVEDTDLADVNFDGADEIELIVALEDQIEKQFTWLVDGSEIKDMETMNFGQYISAVYEKLKKEIA